MQYYALSGLGEFDSRMDQGRRAPLRFALAPGFHIPRRWRWFTYSQLIGIIWLNTSKLRTLCIAGRTVGAARRGRPYFNYLAFG